MKGDFVKSFSTQNVKKKKNPVHSFIMMPTNESRFTFLNGKNKHIS